MIISETITIKTDKLPPEVDFIEEQITQHGFKPVRWAIVDVKDNEILLSVSGYKL
ncbi:MAG: hypothetical protein IJ877_05220 [Candidatus Gastranaerophilales bacterium]|nr:hypothetical protein [Candidatus Gastranaerophilales bacterium]